MLPFQFEGVNSHSNMYKVGTKISHPVVAKLI